MSRWGRQEAPLVIAHRGACAERTENTLAAFRLAEERGADGIELDVMRCGSGEVVVFHDDDLVRLAARPERVRETPLPVLRRVELRGGGRIPTLEEVFEQLGAGMLVNVELKSPDWKGLERLQALVDDGLAREVARSIAGYGLEERALVSSFDPLQLARFRLEAPRVPIGLLFHDELARPLREGWAARPLRAEAVHPEAKQVSVRAVDRWHARGRAVNVWTVDDPREIAFLETAGVDGIITNRPEVARAVIGRQRGAGEGARAAGGVSASRPPPAS